MIRVARGAASGQWSGMSRGDAAYFHQTIKDSLRAIEAVGTLEAECLAAASLIAERLKYGNKLMACGNGGSAADSCHFTTELLCRFEGDRRSLAAISLTADASFLTAAGNDYDFPRVFTRQIEGLGKPGDVLVTFSTSGNSPNIIAALHTARERGVHTISLLGRDGGSARGLAEVEIIVPATSTARIQEAHKLILHLLCGLVERRLFPKG